MGNQTNIDKWIGQVMEERYANSLGHRLYDT
ncbi:MAG: hypothetical protein KatS3mg057_0474 [Herpetosiphonaceae bacterium]|nr:MAG: hypothetical protein KatS3mg057_0474 [Herpetosiphonaceae bacterium]